jgi:hypothetical protein
MKNTVTKSKQKKQKQKHFFLKVTQNMKNKINKERRRSMNATPHDPATRTNGKEPRRS